MTVQIYHTNLGRKAPLQTIEEGHVKLYVCGITAYDYCHIGHARSALVFDMIVAYLRYRGYKVTYVRNFTDIDDKIIKRAAEQNTSPEELANRFIVAFNEDMASLGIATPDLEPKATEHIPEIIAMIEELIAKGLAYPMGNDVYFAVDKFPNYGALSGRTLEDMQAGARIAVNEQKHHPMDFALWKGSKPGEPVWDSPWGPGRPGWHIECSAMSRKVFGPTFDIHGGGKDLVFPHHENEVAQSVGANDAPFVNTWIHHGFVTIKDEKMSKSLNNFLTIREVLRDHTPEALRFFVFSSHYRTPLDYSETALKDAQTGLERLYSCLADLSQLPAAAAPGQAVATAAEREKIESLPERFRQAMDNDFNTAQAFGHLFDTVKPLNRIRQALAKNPAASDLALLQQGAHSLKELANIMGLLRQDPLAFARESQARQLAAVTISATEIETLIQARLAARTAKNWARADEIRDELLAKQILLKDGPEGTSWQVQQQPS